MTLYALAFDLVQNADCDGAAAVDGARGTPKVFRGLRGAYEVRSTAPVVVCLGELVPSDAGVPVGFQSPARLVVRDGENIAVAAATAEDATVSFLPIVRVNDDDIPEASIPRGRAAAHFESLRASPQPRLR